MRKKPSAIGSRSQVAQTARAAARTSASLLPPCAGAPAQAPARAQPGRTRAFEPASPPQAPELAGSWVVVELGSEWPPLTEPAGAVRRVITQLEGEGPAAFAERAADALDRLFGRSVKLATVALSCNERVDDAADAARRKIAGLALGVMAKQKSGRVCLTAAPRCGGRLRHSLSSLAQGLYAEWRTAGLEVSVEFGDARQAAPRTAAFVAARVA